MQAWGGPADGWDWPDTEHGIYVDYKDVVWIGGNNPIAQIRLSSRSDDMLLKFTSKGKLIKQFGGRDKSGGNKDTKNLQQPADVRGNTRRPTRPSLPTATAIAASSCSTPTPARSSACGAPSATRRSIRRRLLPRQFDRPPARPRRRPAIVDGDGPPQFGIVHSIKLSNDGLVYVADRGNSRVQVFTPDGKYQTRCSSTGRPPSPTTACGLALSPDPQQRFLYVSDFGNGHTRGPGSQDAEGRDAVRRAGSQPGNFRNAHHIATDSKGNLYTAEVNPGSRVQKMVFKGLKPQSTTAAAKTAGP